jgi:hypothetical protein
MSVLVLKGNPAWPNGIPRECNARIEVLPSRISVHEWPSVSGSISVDLDPGKYILKITKYLGTNGEGRNEKLDWQEEFYCDVTEKEWRNLIRLSLVSARSTQTSEGPRFLCQMLGNACKFKTASQIQMILHEAEHLGLTREQLLASPNPSVELEYRAESSGVGTLKKEREAAKPAVFNSQQTAPASR